ncbi:hypothetical protein ACHAP7_009857 [Fusarium lateritium]
MPHSTDSVDDQEWELVNGMTELSFPESQIPLSMTPYTIAVGKQTRVISYQVMHDKNADFVPYFDEQRRFKHNDWPECTNRIILGYILHKNVLKELNPSDPQKKLLLHFICLLKFREHVRQINIMDLRMTAEIALADVTDELPFDSILRVIVQRPTWCAFDQDNALLMILVRRVNAWSDKIPDVEISRLLQAWPDKDMIPTNHVLKMAIELRLELERSRRLVRELADRVTETQRAKQ